MRSALLINTTPGCTMAWLSDQSMLVTHLKTMSVVGIDPVLETCSQHHLPGSRIT